MRRAAAGREARACPPPDRPAARCGASGSPPPRAVDPPVALVRDVCRAAARGPFKFGLTPSPTAVELFVAPLLPSVVLVELRLGDIAGRGRGGGRAARAQPFVLASQLRDFARRRRERGRALDRRSLRVPLELAHAARGDATVARSSGSARSEHDGADAASSGPSASPRPTTVLSVSSFTVVTNSDTPLFSVVHIPPPGTRRDARGVNNRERARRQMTRCLDVPCRESEQTRGLKKPGPLETQARVQAAKGDPARHARRRGGECVALPALSVGLPWVVLRQFRVDDAPAACLAVAAPPSSLSEEGVPSPAARPPTRARRARALSAPPAPRARIVAAPLARAPVAAGAAARRARGARFASLTPGRRPLRALSTARAAQPGADALAGSRRAGGRCPAGRLGLPGPRSAAGARRSARGRGARARRARPAAAGRAGAAAAAAAFGLVGASASSVPPAHPTVAVDPPLLLYQNSPICVPAVSQIDVINTSERDELQVYAITADNVQFHPAMFKPQVLQPGARATIQVIFLPRVVGSVEGALMISTSAGV